MKAVHIVGALNVTPDSFYDGGNFLDVGVAVERGAQMIADGADIIEIGGESTGPNSMDVSVTDELRRVIPVLMGIRNAHPKVSISIDTWKPPVAAAALKSGASMINDVTAGRGIPPTMFDVVARTDARIVLMYSKDPTPRTTIHPTQYPDVIRTIKTFLAERKVAAMAAGISADRIILDPGLGHFVSSDPSYSFEIIRRLREFEDLGCPIFLSPSRKSFLAGPEKLPPADRLPSTIAASAIAVFNGATYMRTHDVKEVRRACEVASLVTLSAPH